MSALTQSNGQAVAASTGQGLKARYQYVRGATESLCEPLATEDYVVQSMPDASPAKWHLAHTSWFFEALVLGEHVADYRPFDPTFHYLFNSYYESLGPRHSRPERGLLTRPTVERVYAYRRHVDQQVLNLLDGDPDEMVVSLVELGLHHEQQHQELLVTDLKHLFWSNPLRPAYRQAADNDGAAAVPPAAWIEYPETLAWIGHDGEGFSYDNEQPRHLTFLHAYALGSRLVTNGEYRDFIEDGGYARPTLWLSDGWAARETLGWQAPLYWEQDGNRWMTMTLEGMQPMCESEPVCHVSYYEADAYARWRRSRLPRETEWEAAASGCRMQGNLAERGLLRPTALSAPPAELSADGALAAPRKPRQMFGDVWEWTASAYLPYPGYMPPSGALGEYNAKFMCNQMVLRGGSCVTPRSHLRATYRNFFPPQARWQFSGIRLARDWS